MKPAVSSRLQILRYTDHYWLASCTLTNSISSWTKFWSSPPAGSATLDPSRLQTSLSFSNNTYAHTSLLVIIPQFSHILARNKTMQNAKLPLASASGQPISCFCFSNNTYAHTSLLVIIPLFSPILAQNKTLRLPIIQHGFFLPSLRSNQPGCVPLWRWIQTHRRFLCRLICHFLSVIPKCLWSVSQKNIISTGGSHFIRTRLIWIPT